VCRHRLSTLPSPAAYAQALRAGVDPSVLAQRNREQRTARDLLILHYRHPPPVRDQHSVFHHRVRGQRGARNAHTGLVVYRHRDEQKLGRIRIHINHLIDSNNIIEL